MASSQWYYSGITAWRYDLLFSPLKKHISDQQSYSEKSCPAGVEFKNLLQKHYQSQINIRLLIPQNPKEIPIKDLYTRLVIVGEDEKKIKKEAIKQERLSQTFDLLDNGRIPTHESIFEPKNPIPLENLFDQNGLKTASEKRVVILGSAGIGKSTLCHHIAYQWAKGDLFKEFDYLFWLPLRHLNMQRYSKEASLADYLAKECEINREKVEFFLKNRDLHKKTLLLLDGYDELSPDATNERGSLHPLLKKLLAFPHAIITSRPQLIDIKQGCNLEILGFDSRGIEEYVKSFFSDKEEEQAKTIHMQLKDPLVKSLAHIPINLEILCSLAASDQSFSSTRSPTMTAIYMELTDWLFKRFRIERSPKLNDPNNVIEEADAHHALDVKPLAEVLEEIAWEAMDENTLYLSINQITRISRIVGESIGSIRSIGPFRIENREGVFIHLTFQEYFAAARLARLYKTDREEAQTLLKEIKFEPRYRLVLHMTAGLLSQKAKIKALQNFFDDLLSEPYDLAEHYELDLIARCFQECQDPHQVKQYSKFIEKVVNYLQDNPVEILAVELLHGNQKLFHHPKTVKTIVKKIQEKKQLKANLSIFSELLVKDQLVKDQAVDIFNVIESLAIHQQPIPTEIMDIIHDILIDKNLNGSLRGSILFMFLRIIIRGGDIDDQFIPTLIDMLRDESLGLFTRRMTTYTIQDLAKVKENIDFNVLIDLVLDRSLDRLIRWGAAEALGEFLKIKGDIGDQMVSDLINTAQDHSLDQFTRWSAATALLGIIKRGRDICDLATVTIIDMMQYQLLDEQLVDDDIRKDTEKLIVGMLGEALKESSIRDQAIYELISILQNSSLNWFIRVEAAKALGSVRDISDQIISILIDIVRNRSSDEFVRGMAAEALGEIAKKGGNIGTEGVAAIIDMMQDRQFYKFLYYIRAWTIGWLDSNKSIESSVAQALGNIVAGGVDIGDQGVTILINIMQSTLPDSYAKWIAAQSLGEVAKGGKDIGNKGFTALITTVQDPWMSPYIREAAAQALGEVAKRGKDIDNEAVAALITTVQDQWLSSYIFNTAQDPLAISNIRRAAAQKLGEFAKGGKDIGNQGVDALIDLVQDPFLERAVREHSLNALKHSLTTSHFLAYAQKKPERAINVCRLAGYALIRFENIMYLVDKREKKLLGGFNLNYPKLKERINYIKEWRQQAGH